MAQYPRWIRDELILALDLYFRIDAARTSAKHPEVVSLSSVLRSLQVHPNATEFEFFRHPSSVYMKLCNFLSLDPDYAGKGLQSTSRLDKIIWDEFANDREYLANIARGIRKNAQNVAQSKQGGEPNFSMDEEFAEGRILTRLHTTRERNQTLVKKKKQSVLDAHGKLECEVCGFDFAKVYGQLGTDFAECHHTTPLHQLRESTHLRLPDLAIVCANCHRMLHRSRPPLTVQQLRATVTSIKEQAKVE